MTKFKLDVVYTGEYTGLLAKVFIINGNIEVSEQHRDILPYVETVKQLLAELIGASEQSIVLYLLSEDTTSLVVVKETTYNIICGINGNVNTISERRILTADEVRDSVVNYIMDGVELPDIKCTSRTNPSIVDTPLEDMRVSMLNFDDIVFDATYRRPVLKRERQLLNLGYRLNQLYGTLFSELCTGVLAEYTKVGGRYKLVACHKVVKDRKDDILKIIEEFNIQYDIGIVQTKTRGLRVVER